MLKKAGTVAAIRTISRLIDGRRPILLLMQAGPTFLSSPETSRCTSGTLYDFDIALITAEKDFTVEKVGRLSLPPTVQTKKSPLSGR
jgi:hypothetical protein